jgi:hypothetical protein
MAFSGGAGNRLGLSGSRVDTPRRFPFGFNNLPVLGARPPAFSRQSTATFVTTIAVRSFLEGLSMAGFSVGDPLHLQQGVFR